MSGHRWTRSARLDAINLQRPDTALTTDLARAVGELLPALERFLRFEGPDAARARISWRSRLEEPLPERGIGADAVLRILREVVIPAGLRTGAPGFCGWVTTAPTTIPAAASLAATVSSPQRVWATPGNFLEAQALDWLAKLLGLSRSHQGNFVSGGSVANLVGLGAARQHAGERRGYDPSSEGLEALRSPAVYAGPNVHKVVSRALRVLGLGRRALREVPNSAAGVINVAALREMLRSDVSHGATPVAIVASAGDVNTGAVDPLPELVDLARDANVWLHVDGAYGAFGVLDERVQPLYGDLGLVDSLVADPHKWMAAPIGCGAVFVRDSALLGRAFTLEPAQYLQHDPPGTGDTTSPFEELGYDYHDFGVDQSAPARGLVVWALLKEIGAEGMRARVRRHLDCARLVADRVKAEPNLELLAEPVLSICCFRYRPKRMREEAALDDINTRIVREIRARARCVPSSTRVNGRVAIRPCFINPRSTFDDAKALVDEVLAVARSLDNEA